MSRLRRALLGLAAAASLPVRGGLAADVPASVGVVATGCGALLREVRELPDRLGVELAPTRFEARSTPPAVEIATSCTAVESVTFRDGTVSRTRTVSLEDVAPALRPVALAVLTAEFVRSIWASPAAPAAASTAAMPPLDADTPAPAPTATTPPETAPAPAAPTPPAKREEPPPRTATSPSADRGTRRKPLALTGFGVAIGPTLRYFARPTTFLAGGELILDTTSVFASLNVVGGDNADDLGHVTLGVAAGSIGGRLPLLRLHQAMLSVVAVADVGVTWATSRTTSLRVDIGGTENFFACLSAGPELRLFLTRSFDVLLGARLGGARGLRITADERDVAATQGFTLGVTGALRYAL